MSHEAENKKEAAAASEAEKTVTPETEPKAEDKHEEKHESKYEFAPMIYRVSGTFRAQDPTIEHRMIRINPMRSGPDTIIRILRSCMEQVEEN